MNKITTLLKKGWTVDEIRFDRFQGWYYTHATHETGETANGASDKSAADAIDLMCAQAIHLTPEWYLESLKAVQS